MAARRSEQIAAQKRQQHAAGLTKWERYRETKLEMVGEFIRIMKRKSFVKKFVTIVEGH